MVDVVTDIQIDCPLNTVWQYAANPENAPKWYANIASAECITPGPLKIGSQMAFVAHFLGKKLAYTYEVADLLAGKRLVMRTDYGPFPMETTYTWECMGSNTTKMMLKNKGNPKGFSRLFAPFMARMIKRANNKDLKKLKHILETQKIN